MPRYINAEEALQSFCAECNHTIKCEDCDIKYHLETFVPTADVQEIKRGRWIIDRKFGNDVMSDEQMVICSVCGKGIFWGKQNYCPNCGASMQGEEE